MKLVVDFSDLEKNNIKKALEADGFDSIRVTDKKITFQKGPRSFELLSSNIFDDDDLGLRMYFDTHEFLSSNYVPSKEKSLIFEDSGKKLKKLDPKHKEILKKKVTSYQEKTRHTISLNKKMDDSSDEEMAMADLRWEILNYYSLDTISDWVAENESSLYHVMISGRDHIIIDNRVYEGTPDAYLAMGKLDKNKLFGDSNLLKVLSKIEKD